MWRRRKRRRCWRGEGRPWEAGGWGPQCPGESEDGWVRPLLSSSPLIPPTSHQHIPSLPHDQDRPEARGETQQRISSGLELLKRGKKEKVPNKLSPQVGTHRSRVPWAVRIQREEEQEEWGKKVRDGCILMQ